MSVAYTSQCPPWYEPAGFVATSSHSINPKHWDNMWKPVKKDVAVWDAPYHTVKVTRRDLAFSEPTTSQLQDVHMSKQLIAMQTTSSNQYGGATSTLPAPRASGQNRAEGLAATTPTRKRKSLDDPEDDYLGKKQRLIPVFAEQRDAEPPNPLKGLTLDAKRRRKRILVPEKLAELVIHAYSLNALNRISGPIFDEDKLKCGVISRMVKSQEVSCDCGCPSSSSEFVSHQAVSKFDCILTCHSCIAHCATPGSTRCATASMLWSHQINTYATAVFFRRMNEVCLSACGRLSTCVWH